MQVRGIAVCICALVGTCTAMPLPSGDTKVGEPTSTILATQRTLGAPEGDHGNVELATKAEDPEKEKKKAQSHALKVMEAVKTRFEPYPETSPETEVVVVAPPEPTPNKLDSMDAPCPTDPKDQAKVTRIFDKLNDKESVGVVKVPLYGFEWQDDPVMNASSFMFHPQQHQPSEYTGTHTPYQQATGFLKRGVVLDKRYAEQARKGQQLPDKERQAVLSASTANYKGGMKIVLQEDEDLTVRRLGTLPAPAMAPNPDKPGQEDLQPIGEDGPALENPDMRAKTGALYIHTN